MAPMGSSVSLRSFQYHDSNLRRAVVGPMYSETI